MICSKPTVLAASAFSLNMRIRFGLLAGLLALPLLFIGNPANAQQAHFRYNGGRWSHNTHAGWHRYWGGPSIGFYFAPTPVYLVSGYSRASYYSGPTFWYSNPSFGLNVNVGGGSYSGGRYRNPRYSGGGYQGGNRSSNQMQGSNRDHYNGDRSSNRMQGSNNYNSGNNHSNNNHLNNSHLNNNHSDGGRMQDANHGRSGGNDHASGNNHSDGGGHSSGDNRDHN